MKQHDPIAAAEGAHSQGNQGIRVRRPAPGPRTDAGKAASSRNSLRHGLTAAQVVIQGEDQAEFDRLAASIVEDRKPQGEVELQLAGEIAACTWRLARARRYETYHFECNRVPFQGSAAKQLELLIRYSGSIERQLNRAIVRLEQLQASRRKAASTKPAPEPVAKVMVAGAVNANVFSDLPLQGEFVSSDGSASSPESRRSPGANGPGPRPESSLTRI